MYILIQQLIETTIGNIVLIIWRANAVLSPGTILEKNSIVKRLELIEQTK